MQASEQVQKKRPHLAAQVMQSPQPWRLLTAGGLSVALLIEDILLLLLLLVVAGVSAWRVMDGMSMRREKRRIVLGEENWYFGLNEGRGGRRRFDTDRLMGYGGMPMLHWDLSWGNFSNADFWRKDRISSPRETT